MNIGERIKQARLEKGLDQLALCEKLSIEQSTLSNYENGRRIPKPDMIVKMADIFGVSTDYLLGKTDMRTPNGYSSATTAISNTDKHATLTSKDHIEIDEYIENFENELLSQTGLMLDGEPMTQESKEKLLAALRIGAEMAKKEAKEKYTPKKYRK